MNAIYARQSVDRADSISIESQIEFCQYEMRGEQYKVYTDRGYSGKNTDRPRCRPAPAAAHGRVPPVPDRRSPPMGYTADSTQSHRT